MGQSCAKGECQECENNPTHNDLLDSTVSFDDDLRHEK